jgi:hypothetical protein
MWRCVNLLQDLLDKATSMNPTRRSHFIIDPGNRFMPLLSNAPSVASLHATWMALLARLEGGERHLFKYIAEAEGAQVTSPQSTDPGLISAFHAQQPTNEALSMLYRRVPRHRDSLAPLQRSPFDRTSKTFDEIWNTPSQLTAIFPEQSQEAQMGVRYVSADGVLYNRTINPARTSFGASGDWVPPEPSTKTKGKQRVSFAPSPIGKLSPATTHHSISQAP